MNLKGYRESDLERKRTEDLIRLTVAAKEQLIRKSGEAITAIDIGARDGHFTRLLSEHFFTTTALDLEKPTIDGENITSVQGNVTNLDFESNSFDFVLCAEVLEHIPPNLLQSACLELIRISSAYVLIGVPFNQDLRFGRTTCSSCGKKNPPWGHVNSFTEDKLIALFQQMEIIETSHVGITKHSTNFLSTYLMDLAGNPYGTYSQDELCVHCGAAISDPSIRTLLQKGYTKAASKLVDLQLLFTTSQPNWIHILFKKTNKTLLT